jgi:hypothetical protein
MKIRMRSSKLVTDPRVAAFITSARIQALYPFSNEIFHLRHEFSGIPSMHREGGEFAGPFVVSLNYLNWHVNKLMHTGAAKAIMLDVEIIAFGRINSIDLIGVNDDAPQNKNKPPPAADAVNVSMSISPVHVVCVCNSRIGASPRQAKVA